MSQIDTSASSSPVFVMLVGPPGVGKTTWCQNKLPELIKSGVISRISSDDHIENMALRAGKTYTEVFKDAIAEAGKLAKINFQLALSQNNHIVWDQTNLSSKKRKGLVNQLPDSYTKICVYWVVKNKNEWARRLVRPGKVIPQSVLDSMLASYTYPTYNEGWGKIIKEVVS